MKRTRKSGFSLLEVIAAIVILAVVAAATVATVAPMRAKSEDRLAEQELATLNALAQAYFRAEGNYPRNVTALADAGYMGSAKIADMDDIERMQHRYDYSPATGLFSKK